MATVDGERVAWAREEYGSISLGHNARNLCAVEVLACMARGRGSVVTKFATTSAERQQAYGFFENDQILPEELTAASARAAFGRSEPDGWILAPVDGSSLNLTDNDGAKGFGSVGSHTSTSGLIVQSALALDSEGTPLGVLAQVYWARPLLKQNKSKKKKRRSVEEKETRYWLEVVMAAERSAVNNEMDGRLWFQLDRGYDAGPLLEHAAESSNRFTIRGAHNRALVVPAEADANAEKEVHRYVEDALTAAPVIARMSIDVPAAPGRKARRASLEVRVAEMTLRISDPSKRTSAKGPDGKRRRVPVTRPCTMHVVHVTETGAVGDDVERLEWTLWSNHPVTTQQEAILTVRAYAYRWRIEEFHKLWKSGAMRIEDSQMRSVPNIERVARGASAVACRILRMTLLARTCKDSAAEDEFTEDEIQTLTLFDPHSPNQEPRQETPASMAWAVAVLADLGGYTGKSSGGPPGPLVLARGLARLSDLRLALSVTTRNRDQ